MFGLSLLILLQARLPELARHQYKTARIFLPSPNSLLSWDYIAPHSLRLSARITLHRCSQVLLQHRLQFLHADGFHEKSRGTVESGSLLIRRSEEHTSELQSQFHIVCRLLLEKKKIHAGEVQNALIIQHQKLVHTFDFMV